MGTVRVEDFPSDTNENNFVDDVERNLPGIHFEIDWEKDAVLFERADYEANKEQIDEFARNAGGIVFDDGNL